MTKLAVIGGFLGSGKTSVILRLAQRYLDMGVKIGVVTNDKGSQLVDGAFLKANALPSFEVGGGCFCTNFSQFADVLERLRRELAPDIILAEPVGSYMDILSALFQPVEHKYGAEIQLAPLLVTVDPARLLRWDERKRKSRLTPIDRLFESQLMEADLLVLNKSDRMSPEQLHQCVDLANGANDSARLIAASALENTGLEEVPNWLLNSRWDVRQPIASDIENHCLAEESMAWVNASYHFQDVSSFHSLLREAMTMLRERMQGSEIAHIKMLAIGKEGWLKAGFGPFDDLPVFSADTELSGEVQVQVNARVESIPKRLEHLLHLSLISAARAQGASTRLLSRKSFSPTRQQPNSR